MMASPDAHYVATLLNEHGYVFHYAVMRVVKESFDRKSPWRLEVAEFPVSTDGKDSRIDFVLKHFDRDLFLVAECKRVNRAFSHWCFFRAPYVRFGREHEPIMVERWDGGGSGIRARGATLGLARDAYHLAFAVKNPDAKGTASAREIKHGAVDDAANQVARHVSGLVRQLHRSPGVLGGPTSAFVVPVVFTTAQLYVSDVDLSTASIETGDLPVDAVSLTEAPWVTYQYHESVSARGNLITAASPTSLGDLLDLEFMRTIFVVRSDSIEPFLDFAGGLR